MTSCEAGTQLPQAFDVVEALQQPASLLLVRFETEPDPGKGVPLRVPRPLAHLGEDVVVLLLVPAQIFLDARELRDDPFAGEHERLQAPRHAAIAICQRLTDIAAAHSMSSADQAAATTSRPPAQTGVRGVGVDARDQSGQGS